jgi:hypothetical protein
LFGIFWTHNFFTHLTSASSFLKEINQTSSFIKEKKMEIAKCLAGGSPIYPGGSTTRTTTRD